MKFFRFYAKILGNSYCLHDIGHYNWSIFAEDLYTPDVNGLELTISASLFIFTLRCNMSGS